MTTGVTSRWWWTVAAPLLAPLVACGGSGGSIEASGRIADVPVTPGVGEANAEHTAARPRSNGGVSLARAVAGAADRPYRVVVQATSGFIVGKIGGGQPLDTSITPTHDRSVCRPFTQSLVSSRAGGVGNSVVWLAGVTQGPRDDAPRRVRVLLDGCRLEPRVRPGINRWNFEPRERPGQPQFSFNSMMRMSVVIKDMLSGRHGVGI